MRRVLSLLLAVCMLLSLTACVNDQPDDSTPPATQTQPTDPTQTDPKPSEPADDRIVVEAEKPSDKFVDTEARTDQGGNPMDHSYRKSLLGADGLHYANDAKTAIMFSAFDSYTYTFEAGAAGKYKLYIVASCDRDSPIQYTVNGVSASGNFIRNDYQGYDEVHIATVYLQAGTNTLTVTITENKNHNMMTDKYILVPDTGDTTDPEYRWDDIINAAAEAEKITPQVQNPVWKELYISPNGKDSNDGSKDAPFATITAASEAVSKIREQMQGDIIVHVAGGYYPISEPIVIGVDGGGANGYRVIYRGDSSDKPVISGGVQITGWKQDGNIWSAPCDVEDTRTLYVNDNLTVRARSEFLYVGSESYVSGKTEYTSDGMIVKHRKFPVMTNLDRVELVFDSEWMHHRYHVQNIIYEQGKVYIEMQQPYWDELLAANQYAPHYPGLNKGFYVENAMELLDEPGEFYFDKDAKRIYYYPFPEEDMKTAECYVGATEMMFEIRGEDKNNKIDGLSFENIQFKYGAWNEVSVTGMLTTQADKLQNTAAPGEDARMPAQIEVEYARNITFKDCIFACLGSSAVGMANAVTDSLIDGCVFRDISGIAVTIGTSNHDLNMTEDMERPARIDVTNNVIRRAGAEFRSSPGIMAYYVTSVRIMHNDIACVPSCGISLGWGWGTDVKECQGNLIAYNKIVDVMKPTHDGAHIYFLSPNYNTYINNNWCVTSGDMRGGVYADEGAAHFNIFHNVIEDVDTYWVFARPGVYLRDINVFQNYSDTDQTLTDRHNVIMDDNTVVMDGNWPEEAKQIMTSAGLCEEYKGLLEGVDYPAWRTNFVKEIPFEY